MRLIVILLSFVAFVAGGFPPKFPENCQLTGTAASHQVSSSSEFGTIAGCVVTGNSCQSNSECAAIDTSSMCQGDTLQSFVTCHEGFCKYLGQNAGDYCDCTMGCIFYNMSGDLECTNNKCSYKACAKCGESNAKYACCPPGVSDNGTCYCKQGGCIIKNDCGDVTSNECCQGACVPIGQCSVTPS